MTQIFERGGPTTPYSALFLFQATEFSSCFTKSGSNNIFAPEIERLNTEIQAQGLKKKQRTHSSVLRPLVPPFSLSVCHQMARNSPLLQLSISSTSRQSASTRFTWLPCWGTTICCACWWRTEPIFSSEAPRPPLVDIPTIHRIYGDDWMATDGL